MAGEKQSEQIPSHQRIRVVPKSVVNSCWNSPNTSFDHLFSSLCNSNFGSNNTTVCSTGHCILYFTFHNNQERYRIRTDLLFHSKSSLFNFSYALCCDCDQSCKSCPAVMFLTSIEQPIILGHYLARFLTCILSHGLIVSPIFSLLVKYSRARRYE